MMAGIIALLVANFIGGALSPVFVKFGVREIPPLIFTTLRFVIAIIIFLPFYLGSRERLKIGDIKIISFYSIFLALNVSLFAIGLQFTTIIVSQILYTLVPVFVGIFSYIILREKFPKIKIMGALVALIGVIFIILQSVEKQQSLTFGTPLGNIIILGAVLSWAMYVTLSKKLTDKYKPVTTTFYGFLLTIVILGIFTPFEIVGTHFSIARITNVGIGNLIGAGIISSALSYFLIQYGIKRTTPFISSVFFYFAPFFASITAIPLAQERITIQLVLGGLLIIIGVFFVASAESVRKRFKNEKN